MSCTSVRWLVTGDRKNIFFVFCLFFSKFSLFHNFEQNENIKVTFSGVC